ncbi:MAG TPA: hypothetical protein VFE37_05970 [Chloroflexota bacterium]|nr:hypothetical protein [Chloroflexota bacterium]
MGTSTLAQALGPTLRAELRRREQRHRLSSQEFYQRFQAGQIGEEREFHEWAGLCQMAVRWGVWCADEPPE